MYDFLFELKANWYNCLLFRSLILSVPMSLGVAFAIQIARTIG